MLENSLSQILLLLVAFGASRFQSVRQCLPQLPPFVGARSFLHHAPDVVGEDAIIVEDTVDVDVVELVGVLGLGGQRGREDGEDYEGSDGETTHGD